MKANRSEVAVGGIGPAGQKSPGGDRGEAGSPAAKPSEQAVCVDLQEALPVPWLGHLRCEAAGSFDVRPGHAQVRAPPATSAELT